MTITQDIKFWRGEDFLVYFVVPSLDFAGTDFAIHVRERRLDTVVQIEATKANGRLVDASDVSNPERIALVLTAAETLAIDIVRGHFDLVVDFTTTPVAIISGRVSVGTRTTRLVGAGDALTPFNKITASEGNLFDLLDVDGAPIDGDVLTFDGTDWKPEAQSSGTLSKFESSGTALEIPTMAKTSSRIIIKNVGSNILSVTIQDGSTIKGLSSFALPAYWSGELFYDGSVGVGDFEAISFLDQIPNVIPLANFTISTASLVTTFTDTSTDSDGTIASWAWSFSSGAASQTVQNPVVIETVAGTYNATLVVTDNIGAVSIAKILPYTVTDAPADALAVTGATPVVAFQPTGLALADNAAVASVTDLQGANDMSITAGAVYKTAGIGAIEFNAASVGTFGNNTLLDFMYSVGPTFTLAMVVDVNNTAYQSLFRTRSVTPTPGFILYATVAEGDRYRSEQYDDTGVDKVLQTATGMAAGWVDLVIHNDGDTTNFYINGVSVKSNTGASKTLMGPHDIAQISDASPLALRDFRVYNSALSPAQLAERTAAIALGNYLQ